MLGFNIKDLYVASFFVLVLIGAFFLEKAPQPEQIVDTRAEESSNEIFLAESLFAYDPNTEKVLFKKNEETVLPLASITKLMTAYVALSSLPKETVVTISKQSLMMPDDHGLLVDEKWQLSNIIEFMLLVSSNDAARSIRETYENIHSNSFIASMNVTAVELGMMKTIFYNESGLDAEETAGAYGTALDVAILLDAFSKKFPEALSGTGLESRKFTSLSGIVHNVENTNKDINTFPGRLGSKTGLTDIAGGNLAFIFDRGILSPVVAVVLGSTKDGRFADMHLLVESIMEKELAPF